MGLIIGYLSTIINVTNLPRSRGSSKKHKNRNLGYSRLLNGMSGGKEELKTKKNLPSCSNIKRDALHILRKLKFITSSIESSPISQRQNL
jgi:hypothetical protein